MRSFLGHTSHEHGASTLLSASRTRVLSTALPVVSNILPSAQLDPVLRPPKDSARCSAVPLLARCGRSTANPTSTLGKAASSLCAYTLLLHPFKRWRRAAGELCNCPVRTREPAITPRNQSQRCNVRKGFGGWPSVPAARACISDSSPPRCFAARLFARLYFTSAKLNLCGLSWRCTALVPANAVTARSPVDSAMVGWLAAWLKGAPNHSGVKETQQKRCGGNYTKQRAAQDSPPLTTSCRIYFSTCAHRVAFSLFLRCNGAATREERRRDGSPWIGRAEERTRLAQLNQALGLLDGQICRYRCNQARLGLARFGR